MAGIRIAFTHRFCSHGPPLSAKDMEGGRKQNRFEWATYKSAKSAPFYFFQRFFAILPHDDHVQHWEHVYLY
jgi:hypothetical protein